MPPKRLKLLVRPQKPSGFTSNTMASAPSPEDTIRVQQPLSRVSISDSDDDSENGRVLPPIRLHLTDSEQDDDVEEYDFSNEPEDDPAEYEDDELDTLHYKYANGAMMISSDDEGEKKQEETFSLKPRPWKSKDFGTQARHAYESMYYELTNNPMLDVNGIEDWEITEDYMRERDNEMLRYVEDYPIPRWVIAPAKAQDAYSRLLERVRWRGLGTRIYNQNSMPGMATTNYQPFQSVSSQMPQQIRYPNQPMRPGAMGPPQLPQHMQPPDMPHGMASRMPMHAPYCMPPPNSVLPSQPNAQPMSNSNGMPTRPPSAPANQANAHSHMAASGPHSHRSPTSGPHAHMPPPGVSGNKGKARQRTVTPDVDMTPLSAPTPPYETRPRPKDMRILQGRANNRTALRRNRQGSGDVDVFPWNRKLDFKTAKASAAWDDSIYDQAMLAEMDATRTKNRLIIDSLDGKKPEDQRSRQSQDVVEGSSDAEIPKGKKTKAKDQVIQPQQPGNFIFATAAGAQKAASISKKSADDVVDAYENGELSLAMAAQIHIRFNTIKKDSTKDLQQISFSVKDSIATREQVDNMPILTHKAAERIIDFAPDLLFRDMLLRITSEAGFGNKEIRDRMAVNGNYVDKATITKRIGAALGQKQYQNTAKTLKDSVNAPSDPGQAETKRLIDEEEAYYQTNAADFSNYMTFFGLRGSHRNQLLRDKKRKFDADDASESSGLESLVGSPRKRKRSVSVQLIEDSDEMTGVESEVEGGKRGVDEVSVQSDTILDEMDED